MLSKKIKKPTDAGFKEYYRVLLDDEHIPCELDKDHVDFVLNGFLKHFQSTQRIIENLYEYDYELYRLLFKDSYDTLDIDEGKSWRIDNVIYAIEELIDSFKTNDDYIKSAEESMLLSDLGFKNEFWDRNYWAKVIEDTDEKEIVEEVILRDEMEPLHRERTTIWEKTDFGKSSKSITYKELPLTAELKRAAKNDNKKD